ncbi:uncharacterized protein LOC126668394 [Mercurialis annua]|uniref:uncharacterized protein LOC126668394 n=1 Tax=Mercurialis annua TaxID=3986 RepID=UPI00215F3B74|nr:uncharacterized protein LOC126668394 [Mercurialis annua]
MSEPAGAGSGPVRHTGGSRSALKHMDVMERELDQKPSATELYTRLHSTKADKKPVDKRAQDMTDAITERLAAATQPQTGEGSSSSPAAVDETQVFLDIEGINKKKCVYGLGSASSRYAGPSSRVQRGSSSRTSQQADEEVERRVQAGIQEGLRLAREQQAANMAQMIREEIVRMIPNLPAEYRPQPPPTPPDDDDTPGKTAKNSVKQQKNAEKNEICDGLWYLRRTFPSPIHQLLETKADELATDVVRR